MSFKFGSNFYFGIILTDFFGDTLKWQNRIKTFISFPARSLICIPNNVVKQCSG